MIASILGFVLLATGLVVVALLRFVKSPQQRLVRTVAAGFDVLVGAAVLVAGLFLKLP